MNNAGSEKYYTTKEKVDNNQQWGGKTIIA
jgi:hypothetical protein